MEPVEPVVDARAKYSTMSKAKKMLSDLFEAAKRGDISALESCLNLAVAESRASREETLSGFRDGNGRHALHFGAASGSAEAVRWLAGVCRWLVDLADEQGVRPLAIAASRGKVSSCEALLALGANARHCDKRGATALHRAAAFEGPECAAMVGVLCAAGAFVAATAATSGTPLHWAAGNDDGAASRAATEALVACGSPLEATDDRGLTPVVLAAAVGNGQTVAALAKAGADVGLIVSGGATVAHMCAERGDLEALQAVASGKHGNAAVRAVDGDGRTPLDVAEVGSHQACAEFLASLGVPRLSGTAREAPPAPAPTAPAPTAPAAHDVKDPDGALRHKNLGNAALKRGDYQQAIAEYTAGIDLDASNKALFSNRSAAFLALAAPHGNKRRDLLQNALDDADACIHLDATWAKAHFRRAAALMAHDNFEDAATAYWEALRLDPNNAELRKALKDCVDRGRLHFQAAQHQGTSS